MENTVLIDCPALHVRAKNYPFQNRVPVLVKPRGDNYGDYREAGLDAECQYYAYTDECGLVCAVSDSCSLVPLRHGSFDVVEWIELVGEPEQGKARRWQVLYNGFFVMWVVACSLESARQQALTLLEYQHGAFFMDLVSLLPEGISHGI